MLITGITVFVAYILCCIAVVYLLGKGLEIVTERKRIKHLMKLIREQEKKERKINKKYL